MNIVDIRCGRCGIVLDQVEWRITGPSLLCMYPAVVLEGSIDGLGLTYRCVCLMSWRVDLDTLYPAAERARRTQTVVRL